MRIAPIENTRAVVSRPATMPRTTYAVIPAFLSIRVAA